jgi:hypothetical protein
MTNDLISQCINGERPLDCEHCPEHSSRGGACCFGIRHEYGDSDCSACYLNEECARITHHIPDRDSRYSRRIIYPSTPLAKAVVRNTPMYGQRPTRAPVTTPNNVPLLPQSSTVPDPIEIDPKHGLLQQFLLVGMWGAMEGFFTLVLDFLRKKRPQ